VRKEHGYSLVELLVVVAMIAAVMLVTLPALMQLMPQYRIRSAATEAAGAMRLARQRAVTMRTPWRVSIDANGNRYRFYQLESPFADVSDATKWVEIRRDGRTADVGKDDWFRLTEVDLQTAATTFNDVVCPAGGGVDLIFLRDGAVAGNAPCSGGAALTFATNPGIVMAVDSTMVRFNRYTITVSRAGSVTVTPSKV
jgi:prepilin-type N-terminal cleavage/methylation domain-containing protein